MYVHVISLSLLHFLKQHTQQLIFMHDSCSLQEKRGKKANRDEKVMGEQIF